MVRSSKGDKVLTILQCQDYIVYLICASYIHPSHNPPHVLLVTSVLSHIPTSYFRLSHGITNDVRHPFHCYMGEGGLCIIILLSIILLYLYYYQSRYLLQIWGYWKLHVQFSFLVTAWWQHFDWWFEVHDINCIIATFNKKAYNFQSKLSFRRSMGQKLHENNNVLPKPALLPANVSETVPTNLSDNGSF